MRYAVYYMPFIGSDFERAGNSWLVQHDAIFEDARRYGFHATLKAPFRLAADRKLDELLRAVAMLAQDFTAAPLGRLNVDISSGFLSLRPQRWADRTQALIDECVVALDYLRDELSPDEIARRRKNSLTQAQEKNLLNYGYPYIFQDFHFHMTLSAHADDVRLAGLARLAEMHFKDFLIQDHSLNCLTVCREAAPGATFEVIEQFTLKEEHIWPEVWKWATQ